MADHDIFTYLNDHLAGSVVALELLEHLKAAYENTDLEQFFAQLKADIAADRRELEAFMAQLGITESGARKASAWLTEKITELKLRIDDPKDGPLRLFESLEALSLGIEGKRSLWIALAAAAENSPRLKTMDYQRLVRRAQEQRDRVEELRIDTARKTLTPESS